MGTPAAQKVALDAVAQEIGKCYSTLMNGYMNGDWKITSQIYGPNCTILAPGKSTIRGREGAENYWRNLKEETGITKIDVKADEINGSGDWYFERGAYKLYKGDALFEERKYLKVWRKYEGKWCIYSYIYNLNPGPAEK